MIRRKAKADLDPWIEQGRASLVASFANAVADSRFSAIKAIRRRARPLRTALSTVLVVNFGLVPMAIVPGAGARVQRPLAMEVFDGIIKSIFLVPPPALQEWVNRRCA